jgi:hypothetical protein
MTSFDAGQGSGVAEADSPNGAARAAETAEKQCSDAATTAAVVGVVAVGALIFEAALIPGMILGVGAMLVPKVLPRLGEGLQPVFRATVRGAYKAGRKASYAFAEAKEQVSDVVAEAKAEGAANQS